MDDKKSTSMACFLHTQNNTVRLRSHDVVLHDRELNLVRASADAAGVRALVPTNVPFGMLQASHEHKSRYIVTL